MFYKLTMATLLVLALGFLGGLYFIKSSWNSKPQMNVSRVSSGDRDPAAIRKVFDFSHLKGGALASASKRRLLQGAEVLRESQRVGLRLGHFVVAGPQGERVFACSRYSQMKLSFEAEGFAVSGERPQMIVKSNCEVSADINRIEPIWLPVAQITEERPGDIELEFMQGNPVSVQFIHLVDSWPSRWELKKIQLINPGSQFEDVVTVDDIDIRRFTGAPFSLTW